MEKAKAFQTSKFEGIQYYQMSITTNVKGSYIVKKYKEGKKSTISNPKQLRKHQ